MRAGWDACLLVSEAKGRGHVGVRLTSGWQSARQRRIWA